MAALVLGAMPLWVTFEAVTVAVPRAFNVTAKVAVPEANAALAGRTALVTLEETLIVSFVFTTFQLASTPLTITENKTLLACARGVPSFPVGVPGAAVSPGT